MAADCYTAAGQAGTAAQREQAPRSLWDTTYVENSWIPSCIGNKAIELIPLMQKKIAASDSVDEALVLRVELRRRQRHQRLDRHGRHARHLRRHRRLHGLLLPTWHDESFTYAGFDVFRNYDGNGAAFGDTSITASTTDVPDSSVYASLDSATPSHLVIVAINKATTAKVAGVQITHSTVYTKASRLRA